MHDSPAPHPQTPRWRLLASFVIMLTCFLLFSGCVGSAQSQHTTDGHSALALRSAARAVLTIDLTHPERQFADGAIGLSVETKELATQNLSVGNSALVALMRLLGPAVLRVGGNSLDLSWWTSNNEPAPAWATSVITPITLASLHRLLIATGWRVILGLDLGHFDPARAANEARVAKHIIGSHLLGFEIGNEPNDYGGRAIGLRSSTYSAEEYLSELSSYINAIRSVSPGVSFYGPDLGWQHAQPWLTELASSKSLAFAELTQHYYPTTYNRPDGPCTETPVPTALELLSPGVRQQENEALQTIIAAGELAHLPVRISETNNTASCDAPGGPATSPVFASALWSLDWTLRAASAGISGLNFHGNLGRCRPEAFAPMCTPAHPATAREELAARPEYYGLLAARQLEGGRFVPTHLSTASPWPNVTTWATLTPKGAVRIAIDNLGTKFVSQSISIPSTGYRATSELLAGPSIKATSNITLGGSRLPQGRWRPERMQLRGRTGFFDLPLRPESAMIVTLRPTRPHV